MGLFRTSAYFSFVLDLPLSISITPFTSAARRRTSPRPRRARARSRASRYNVSQARLRRHAGLLPASPLLYLFYPLFSLLLTSRVEYLSLRIKTPSPDLVRGSPILPFSHFGCPLSPDMTIIRVTGPSFVSPHTLSTFHSQRSHIYSVPRPCSARDPDSRYELSVSSMQASNTTHRSIRCRTILYISLRGDRGGNGILSTTIAREVRQNVENGTSHVFLLHHPAPRGREEICEGPMGEGKWEQLVERERRDPQDMVSATNKGGGDLGCCPGPTWVGCRVWEWDRHGRASGRQNSVSCKDLTRMISLGGQIRSEGKEELTNVVARELRHNVENYITYLPSQAFTSQQHSASREFKKMMMEGSVVEGKREQFVGQ